MVEKKSYILELILRFASVIGEFNEKKDDRAVRSGG